MTFKFKFLLWLVFCNFFLDASIHDEVKFANSCRCDGTEAMLRYQLECGKNSGKEIFDSISFLNSLRNKQLGIMGDSITLQLYHALRNQLFEHHPKVVDGNGTLSRTLDKNHFEAAYTRLRAYNTTIYWCRVSTFNVNRSVHTESMFDEADHDYCSDSLIRRSDYLVVGVGAWFKPLFFNYTELNFTRNTILSNQIFKERIAASRAYIKQMNPSLKVIWRLQPHAGRADELKYLHNDTTMSHWDGWLWNNASECASWVTRYNHMTVAVANQYGDKVMDWYTLSNKYLENFSTFSRSDKLQVHADSMHYCAQGFPRGTMLLLQHAIRSLEPHTMALSTR